MLFSYSELLEQEQLMTWKRFVNAEDETFGDTKCLGYRKMKTASIIFLKFIINIE